VSLATALFLIAAGFVAAFIDAIAGGGGLITLPATAWVVGPGAHAIGTNKIAGTVAALVALWVYASRGHFQKSSAFGFAVWVALGSFLGSRVAPSVPSTWFPFFLAATCPVIIWIVWKKDLWVARERVHSAPKKIGGADPAIILSGLACGFYDGVWGPGGGTFMFLSLFFFAKLPLLSAIAASKLANTASAGASLVSYAAQGFVHPLEGFVITTGVVGGSFLGARHATKEAARIVRPTLVVVSILLLAKLFFDLLHKS
jgi:uncharacterized membrane protein YfcA